MLLIYHGPVTIKDMQDAPPIPSEVVKLFNFFSYVSEHFKMKKKVNE